jgi:hypothetical protein
LSCLHFWQQTHLHGWRTPRSESCCIRSRTWYRLIEMQVAGGWVSSKLTLLTSSSPAPASRLPSKPRVIIWFRTDYTVA